jgi:subtilisin family serine protease
VLAELARDSRVTLAQPLQEFGTLGTPAATVSTAAIALSSAAKGSTELPYNDPYFPLQRGLVGFGIAQAHRCARGDGVRVAVIDTGVETEHPDLAGVPADTANFVDRDSARFQRDHHGTEVAGLIAAQPGNATGIVGIAPGARLLALKACWERNDGSATCNSFTLSQALASAIDRGAQVVNLSLGGPADELLTKLLRVAISRGIVVVGAVPPGGARDGFPLGVPGVIAVQDAALPSAGPVAAPGHEVLTLMPGGRYDFATGSSMAAAHISGLAALLLQRQPSLDGPRIEKLLREQGTSQPSTPLNACRVLEALDPHCGCG